MSAVVAIVGRPNVGKSTLFNRLIGKRQAIESDVPGTTRDRLYQSVQFGDYRVLLVDTGGLELNREGDDLEANVQAQSQVAIDGADLILFVLDVRDDPTAEDFHAASLLRKSKKPVLVIANKCDNERLEEQRFNLCELGFGEPLPVTAIHSYGFDALEEKIIEELKNLKVPKATPLESKGGEIRLAFLGRPNVGKSSMVNALFGKERVVVSEIPGTTRDASEIPFEYKDRGFVLVDTAGIRRRGKIESGLEKYSILRTMQSVSEADICALLLDFEEGITNQDCHVSAHILDERKGLILVVNKVDLEKGKDRELREDQWIRQLRRKMAYVPWAPVVFTSAKDRKNIFEILELSMRIAEERKKVIPQEQLNIWLDQVLKKHAPKGRRGKQIFAVNSVEQVGSNPPHFVFFCDWPELMHFSYARYMENALREQFGFVGVSMQLTFRKPGRG